ncbi:MAG: transcriptional repressor [Candidatus Levybacteria bacterium]|nr:transcriptional repressor [Candidatus Levybacteria bacterium]
MDKQKLLQEKGLKTTTARVALLDFLEQEGSPLDVVTIVEKLHQQADQATVYRILDILTKKDLVNRLEFGEGKYRYEIQKNHHHHLICTNCGTISDVPGDFLGKFEKEIKDKKGFLVKSHLLEFFGLCRSCQS